MPTYDYRCNGCAHEFEAFQRMSEKPKRKCPECGKNSLERLIGTGAGVIFKGSGFYETDYRSESYKKGAEAEKPKKDAGATDSKGGDNKKTEKKADAASKGSDAKAGQSKSGGAKKA